MTVGNYLVLLVRGERGYERVDLVCSFSTMAEAEDCAKLMRQATVRDVRFWVVELVDVI